MRHHATPELPNDPHAPRGDWTTLRRLLPYLWHYKWRVVAALAFMVAAKLATVLQAEKLMMLTNISGVLNKAGELLTELTARQIDGLFADGTLSGGMLPKISGALDAAKSGVNSVHIIDGRVPHVLLLEILTDQAFGTMIRSH